MVLEIGSSPVLIFTVYGRSVRLRKVPPIMKSLLIS